MGNLAKGSPLIKKLIFFCFLLDTSRKSPRGYRKRNFAEIPENRRKIEPRELYPVFPRLRHSATRNPTT